MPRPSSLYSMNGATNSAGMGSASTGMNGRTMVVPVASKKKLGNNLNKLVAKPPPPIANDRSSMNQRQGHNGLLLLSTQKNKTGAAGGTSSAGGTAGGSTNVAAAIRTTSAFSKTTHEVLLSAVSGGKQNNNEVRQPPDAWGVGAQQQQQQQVQQQQLRENMLSPSRDFSTTEQKLSVPVSSTFEENYEPESQKNGVLMKELTSPQQARWDDYGGRGQPAPESMNRNKTSPNQVLSTDGGEGGSDQQVNYMSRLAKERAEKRQQEEREMLREQKERALERLRELDERIQEQERQQRANDTASSPHRNEVAHSQSAPESNAWDRPRTSAARGLWDPSNTDAGSRGNSHLRSTEVSPGSPPTPTILTNPASQSEPYSGPVIHLSSYEDRDRGERNNNAGPRMLFDPKSGSMVAVKSREETGGNSRKKDRKKNRTLLSKHSDLSSARSEGGSDGVVNGKNSSSGINGSRKGSRRKDESRSGNAAAKQESKKNKTGRRLPRTCGVLYARDEKGNLFCVDGTEGDLGYGAHSVPGGRLRNPEGYSEYLKKQNSPSEKTTKPDIQVHRLLVHNADGVGMDQPAFHDQSFTYSHDENHYDQPSYSHGYEGENGFFGDYHPDEPALEPLDWVKANEKIELITGLDDESPTLKPTAKEWAPSQAALAAAAAQRFQLDAASSEEELDDDLDDLVDDDVLQNGPLGLGFDPTQDMDGLIQSPVSNGSNVGSSLLDGKDLVPVDLDALALEPPMFHSSNGNDKPRHIFAFDSSDTWGIRQEGIGGGTDWGTNDVSRSLFVDKVFRDTNDMQSMGEPSSTTTTPAASFFNIPSNHSWGSTHSPFGGIAINGERSKSAIGD